MASGLDRGGRVRAANASLRLPLAPGGRDAPPPAPPAPPGTRPALRLAVSRGLLGIELDAPFSLGPLRVVELTLGLPGVRFPVDLSGGVARFRHRRGALTSLAVEAGVAALAGWAAPRLRGLFAESSPELFVAPMDGGLFAGMRWGGAALAFDLLVAPIDGDLRLLPERARGIGLQAPPQALALRALAAVTAPFGRVVRGAVVVAAAAALLVRRVLPEAGARAPSAEGLCWEAPELGASSVRDGLLRIVLEGRTGAAPPALGDRVLRALELSDLAGDADEAACAGDLDGARRLYLAALERAPRHPEISQRLAWIDVIAGDRPEGALSTIVDAMPAASAGILGGALLAAVGDADGARVALTRAAHAEGYGPLAALTWLEAARLATALDVRLEALDHAVARAPSLDLARWARLEARLDLADVRGARADAEHLEAAARGSEARHAVWRRAAEAFLAHGQVAEAGGLFERALRYAPQSPEAVVGLARALRAAGQDRRAVDLFARAVALAARAGVPAHDAEIELARALAEVAGDRPAAVARVRAIPPGLARSAEARFLEGRWRAELGDLAGSAIAFGRLRDAVELVAPLDADGAAALAAMLAEAADLEERERGDVHAAQRSLGLALRLRPRDPGLAARFRRVAALVVGAAPSARAPEPPPPPPPTPPPPVAVEDEGADHDEADDEQRVQSLTDRLRADPHDHASAMALAGALERLGRDLGSAGAALRAPRRGRRSRAPRGRPATPRGAAAPRPPGARRGATFGGGALRDDGGERGGVRRPGHRRCRLRSKRGSRPGTSLAQAPSMLRQLAAALVVSVGGCLLAASCGTQGPAAKPVEDGAPGVETEDDGDFGGDPDVVGSIGGDTGEPSWWWSPPSCAATGQVGDSDPDPDTGSDVGGGPVGGYVPGGRVRSPGVEPATPCEGKCDTEYDDASLTCARMRDGYARKGCEQCAYSRYKSCRERCQRSSGDDCLEHCKEKCDEVMMACFKKCKKTDFMCRKKCNREYFACLDECDKRCK